jgi:DNA-binding transcriptional MerR regulator
MGSHHPIRKIVAAEPVPIPDKLYFRIGDVARLCDVVPYVLRFWETEFPQLKPNKGGTGQRLYRKKDVEMALRIKSLLYDQGYTIPGARQILKTGTVSTDTPEPSSTTLDTPKQAGIPSASEMWVSTSSSPHTEPDTTGANLRLRAQLADLRDDLQTVLNQLSKPLGTSATAPGLPHLEPAEAFVERPGPHLVLEPKPVPKLALKSAPQTILHLTGQGDLFTAE